jgi:hypothetical protein
LLKKNCFYKFIYLTKNIVVKPSIRPDIRYPAFGLAGYPAKTVSGASLENIGLTGTGTCLLEAKLGTGALRMGHLLYILKMQSIRYTDTGNYRLLCPACLI